MFFPELRCAGAVDDGESNHGTQKLATLSSINTEFQKGLRGQKWKRVSQTACDKF